MVWVLGPIYFNPRQIKQLLIKCLQLFNWHISFKLFKINRKFICQLCSLTNLIYENHNLNGLNNLKHSVLIMLFKRPFWTRWLNAFLKVITFYIISIFSTFPDPKVVSHLFIFLDLNAYINLSTIKSSSKNINSTVFWI